MYDPGSVSENVVLEFGVTGDAGEELRSVATRGDSRRVTYFEDPTAARAAFRQGAIHGLLDARRAENGQVQIVAIVPEGSLRTTLIVVQVKEILADYERTRRGELAHRLDYEPVQTPLDPAASPYFGFSYTVLVPLLVFLPVFISGSIAVDSIVEELERGTMELLRVAPVTVLQIVDGKLLATGVLAPVQAAIWLALLSMNGTAIAHNWSIVVFVTAATIVVVSLAALVAITFRDRSQAQFLYSMLVMVVFGIAYLLPANPANVVARLAIGSPDATTPVTVVASLIVAVAAALVGRVFVSRSTLTGP